MRIGIEIEGESSQNINVIFVKIEICNLIGAVNERRSCCEANPSLAIRHVQIRCKIQRRCKVIGGIDAVLVHIDFE